MKKSFHGMLALLLALLIPAFSFAQTKEDVARSFVQKNAASKWGLTPEDVEGATVSSQTYSKQSGVTHIYLDQRVDGIRVHGAVMGIHIKQDDQVLTSNSRFVANTQQQQRAKAPAITAKTAVREAARQLGYKETQPAEMARRNAAPTPELATVFEGGELSAKEIPVYLVYQPMPDGTLKLAWEIEIEEPGGLNYWLVRVDAATGIMLDKTNYVVHCSFGEHPDGHCSSSHLGHSEEAIEKAAGPEGEGGVGGGSYRVFAEPLESPSFGARTLQTDPADPLASPFGWHDTDGVAGPEYTITRGNNVHASLDEDANNVPGFAPDGGPTLNFDFPLDLTQGPDNYRPAAITNLFYWNNYIHDWTYQYGFDEVSGNFQENNYGRGGAGSDYVNADAQDGSRLNNANFGTPPDGGNPRMQMFVWNYTDPNRDSDLDNGVITHEYGHGISTRLTGGPANSSCLDNVEQMGEGWSDWVSLMASLEPGDVGTAARGIGTYVLGEPTSGGGIRPTPYSTDMTINPATYNSIKTAAVPHGVGYVWCGMIWDLSWKLMEVHGTTAGYNKAMFLIMEGMKLQPCSPGFVDGRNAILDADQALYGGENQCLIWEVFARRGLGWSAVQGSTNSRSDGTQAFDMPPSYILGVAPESSTTCQANTATFTANVTTCSGSGSATLSLSNLPMGAVENFTTNPVSVPNGTTPFTINFSAVAPGTYNITLTATGAAGVSSTTFSVNVIASTLAAPALTTPADGATNVFTTPLLKWDATPNAASYAVEIATDNGFTNMVASANGLQTAAYFVPVTLNELTTYYWRVQAANPCTTGPFSAPFSFTTGAGYDCSLNAASDVPVNIHDLSPVTVTSVIHFSNCGTIESIGIRNLDITHSNTDEIVISLTSPSGTRITLLDRVCTIRTANIKMNLDDGAPDNSYPCPPTNNGFYQPVQPFSSFVGESIVGDWTLTVEDLEPGDGGSINNWELALCITPINATPFTCYRDSDGDGFGDVTKPRLFCVACGMGYVTDNTDCDDTQGNNYPGNTEICDGGDNDCDNSIDEGFDQDNDGFTSCNGDCDDTDPDINPLAVEICNGTDDNCNGSTDEFRIPSTNVPVVISEDGTPVVTSTLVISGLTGNIADVGVEDLTITHTYVNDLTIKLTSPGGTTVTLLSQPCRGENNILITLDDEAASGSFPCPPVDGKSYQPFQALSAFDGQNPNGTWTLTVEDQANQDGGSIDHWTLALSAPEPYYADTDGDGYGDPLVSELKNCAVTGWVINNADCDDTDGNIRPGALEICDGKDNDCDLLTDAADPGFEDTTPPSISCPANIVKSTDLNQCSAVTTYAVTSSDNCGSAPVTRISGPASNTAFPSGTTTVVWQATDLKGLTASCSFTVTVNDGQNPAIVCPANIVRNTDPNQCSAIVTYANPTFTDNCPSAFLTRTGGLASGSQFPKGVNMVNWKATDAAGNTAICNFTVTVNETQLPTIICPAGIVKSTDATLCTAVVTYNNPTVVANCPGASAVLLSGPASGTAFPKGATVVTWKATNSSGGSATCSFTVTINDGQAPAITCPANQTKSTDPGLCTAASTYTTPTFTDNCAGGSVTIMSGLASGSAFPKGATTVIWRATDAAGLTKTCSFKITVNDTQAPTITCPASQTKTTAPNLCTATATYADATFTDNCTGGSVTRLNGLVSGAAFPQGVNNVTFRATDASGNQALCTMTITVTDAQAPAIACPANIAATGTNSNGVCSAMVNYTNPSASDNCTLVSNFLMSGLASGSVFPLGVTTNTWKATDNSGLTAICAFTVTVSCGTGVESEEFEVRSSKLGTLVSKQPAITMSLAPNPATTEVMISVEGILPEESSEIAVFDAQGRLVWQRTMEAGKLPDGPFALSLTNFSSGLYIVTLRSNETLLTQRLIVNRL